MFFRKESKVLVFRDPMGHKVCYFCVDKEIVYFTNDSSYLYSLPIDKKADLNYIYKYLFYQTPGYMEYTSLPIQNCYRCLAGHYLLFELNPEGCISYKQKSYFNVNHIRVNYEATEEETMQFFKEAVYASFEDSSFLLSQGGAVAVSGGLDSTFICSVLQNMGLKSRVNYFSHSIWEDERGYSEDRYLDILESKFNIKVNRFCLYEKIPSLFREDAWGDILDGEPGSLSSIRNFNTIISKVFELNTNRVVFGYTESLYRNVGDSVVTYKEFLGLPNVLKLKYYQHYKQCCRNVTRPRLLSWAANNCCDNAINRNYDKSSVISSRLHDIYIASNSTPLFAKMGVHSIQEVKYENILSPNYETKQACKQRGTVTKNGLPYQTAPEYTDCTERAYVRKR